MIIAGAGGHALEVLDILRSSHTTHLAVYGEKISPKWPNTLPSFSDWMQVEAWLRKDPYFVLGVGIPAFRRKLWEKFTQLGGIHHSLRGPLSVLSPSAQTNGADILTSAFVGAEVRLGLGALINVGAQIHHEVQVGDFSVVNPGAILLGDCQIGQECFIGAHATILPGVKLGDHCVVGAGAVIIRDVPSGNKMVGVPGRILSMGN